MPSLLVLSDVGDTTWGAVLEQGQVVELHVENSRRPGIAGNVYKARVNRVLPGMQSAFLDIGTEKDVFLHISDLPEAAGTMIPFADEEEIGDARAEGEGEGEGERTRRTYGPIEDHLREGQEIVVQIAKEPIAAKGARATAQIALPGRALVYLPFADRVFVSRRIEDADERTRLAAIAEPATRAGGGCIVRTAAEGAPESVLARDAAYLGELWSAIRARGEKSGAPALLHKDLDLAQRLHRDVLSEEFQEVIVDSDRLEALSTEFLSKHLAGLNLRVRLAERPGRALEDLGIHEEIESSLAPRVWLKSGGSIVVNPTEALVSIDVNTGKYVGKSRLEETALKTNLEAVREIVRLLRLRDLGGIIVIDFIDMEERANREALSAALFEELKKDRSRTRLLAMSDFGLVQLTRKRTRRSLDRALQIACPGCDGTGRIRSPIALYYEIQRDLARGALLTEAGGPAVRLHPASIARIEEEGLRLTLLAEDGGLPGAGATGAARRSAASPRLVPDPSISEDRYRIDW